MSAAKSSQLIEYFYLVSKIFIGSQIPGQINLEPLKYQLYRHDLSFT